MERVTTKQALAALISVLTLLLACIGGVATEAAATTPPPTAHVYRGASAVGQPGCTDSACAYVKVVLQNFAPNTTVKITCRANNGAQSGFASYQVRTGAAGRSTSSRCYYGYVGRRVWVTANGVESNHLLWTDAPAQTPTVALSKGAHVATPTCNVSTCAYLAVQLSAFSPNTLTHIECWSELDSVPFASYNVTTDGSGNSSSQVCYFGYPGKSVWVVVNGTQSNHVTW